MASKNYSSEIISVATSVTASAHKYVPTAIADAPTIFIKLFISITPLKIYRLAEITFTYQTVL